MIIKKCFLEVIPRFQNIPDGIKVYSKKVFYEYDKNSILVNPYVLRYFKENYSLLYKAIMVEWAKFLERINLGLPMLISKMESGERYRSSLEK
jgi:hypothetical protein